MNVQVSLAKAKAELLATRRDAYKRARERALEGLMVAEASSFREAGMLCKILLADAAHKLGEIDQAGKTLSEVTEQIEPRLDELDLPDLELVTRAAELLSKLGDDVQAQGYVNRTP